MCLLGFLRTKSNPLVLSEHENESLKERNLIIIIKKYSCKNVFVSLEKKKEVFAFYYLKKHAGLDLIDYSSLNKPFQICCHPNVISFFFSFSLKQIPPYSQHFHCSQTHLHLNISDFSLTRIIKTHNMKLNHYNYGHKHMQSQAYAMRICSSTQRP